MPDKNAEPIAFEFHKTYEQIAPQLGYKTREKSAVDWEDLPQKNKTLMIATVDDLLKRGVIHAGPKE